MSYKIYALHKLDAELWIIDEPRNLRHLEELDIEVVFSPGRRTIQLSTLNVDLPEAW